MCCVLLFVCCVFAAIAFSCLAEEASVSPGSSHKGISQQRMPGHKGRARDTVPHKEHRTSKRASKNSSTKACPLVPFARTAVKLDKFEFDEGSLLLPCELWIRVACCMEEFELCQCEMLAKGWQRMSIKYFNEIWQVLSEISFPAMCRSVRQVGSNSGATSPVLGPLSAPPAHSEVAAHGPDHLEPLETTPYDDQPSEKEHAGSDVLDWKMLFARRWQKQRIWETHRARTRSGSDGVEVSTTFSGRKCVACGELFTNAAANREECSAHSGDFLPRDLSNWNRAELRQLQAYVRAASRSVGGPSNVRNNLRNWRGGGHWAKGLSFKGWGSRGHWAEGLGARPGPGVLRDCIDGKVPCMWCCCGSQELISEGCVQGPHKWQGHA